MKKKEIIEKLDQKMPLLREKYRVESLGLFGSVLRGEDSKESDIDIVVEFSKPVGFFDFIRLENFLTDLLGRKVDLVTKKALKEPIKEDVLKETSYV
jgi:hypothetical protein